MVILIMPIGHSPRCALGSPSNYCSKKDNVYRFHRHDPGNLVLWLVSLNSTETEMVKNLSGPCCDVSVFIDQT